MPCRQGSGLGCSTTAGDTRRARLACFWPGSSHGTPKQRRSRMIISRTLCTATATRGQRSSTATATRGAPRFSGAPGPGMLGLIAMQGRVKRRQAGRRREHCGRLHATWVVEGCEGGRCSLPSGCSRFEGGGGCDATQPNRPLKVSHALCRCARRGLS